MEIVIPNMGWIEAICGPMFSGKSEELIRRLRRAMIARKRVQVFKPAIDDRYSENEIVTHADIRMQSEPVNSAAEILAKLNWRTQVVGIDESNFFGADLIPVANLLSGVGKLVGDRNQIRSKKIRLIDSNYLSSPIELGENFRR